MNMDLVECFHKLIQNESISEAVYHTLERAIRMHSFEEGTRMNPGAIADMLSVSRTPVKEALTRLYYDEMVTTKPELGAGYYTYIPTPAEEHSLTSYIHMLYLSAALMIQNHIDNSSSIILKRKLAEIEDIDDVQEFLDELRFYQIQLVAYTRNPDLCRAFNRAMNKSLLQPYADPSEENFRRFRKRQCEIERELFDLLFNGNRIELFKVMDLRYTHIADYLFLHSVHGKVQKDKLEI